MRLKDFGSNDTALRNIARDKSISAEFLLDIWPLGEFWIEISLNPDRLLLLAEIATSFSVELIGLIESATFFVTVLTEEFCEILISMASLSNDCSTLKRKQFRVCLKKTKAKAYA